MDDNRDTPTDVPLNPALKSATETSHHTGASSPAPVDTTSAREGEGEGWSWIWLVVTLGGIALAIYFIL